MGLFLVLTLFFFLFLFYSLMLWDFLFHNGTIILPDFCSGEDIEVAELKKAYCSWLEISGKIETIDLSPQTLYEIVFVIKIEDPSVWDFMVRLVIVTPSKKWLSRYENLKGKPSNEWFEILVGEYRTSPGDVGLVELRMEEYTSKLSKRGISVQCAIIRPK